MSIIGQGAFGSVVKTETGVVKIYSQEDAVDAGLEIDTLKLIKSNRKSFKDAHESKFGERLKSKIVTLKKWETQPRDIRLHFKQYASTLSDIIDSGKISFSVAMHIYHCIVIGLAELQHSKIIHGDLKPDNIMIYYTGDTKSQKKLAKAIKSENCKSIDIKIIDFNKSVKAESVIKPLDIQTLYYTPPEIIVGDRGYNYSVDIWTAGCILNEMLTGMHLFNVFHKDSTASQTSEQSQTSDHSQTSEHKETFDHFALLHLYHQAIGPFDNIPDTRDSRKYFSNGKLFGSLPTKKAKWQTFNNAVDTIFERTFHYDYNNRLDIDEYYSIHNRVNSR
jgi:serine/threonine protein kinase